MIAAQFPQANKVLVGSPEDKAAGNVSDLHVHAWRDLDNTPHVLSCWAVTDEDLERIIKTRQIWLFAWGTTHPPVSIQSENPFEPKT